MASSSSTADPPRILVATMIVGAKDGGIAFLMGRRQIGPEKGTWFFPSDELLPGEKVEDCVQRVLKQVGMMLRDTWVNKILDHLPAQPLASMNDTFPVEVDDDLCKSATVFAYCLRVDELPEEERGTKKRKTGKDGASMTEDEQPEKMDKLRYFNWNQIETMCRREKSMVPFTALRNFIRKWNNVDWDRNPWNASV